MVRLEERGAGGEALGEAPPSLRLARPRPAPSPRSSLAVFRDLSRDVGESGHPASIEWLVRQRSPLCFHTPGLPAGTTPPPQPPSFRVPSRARGHRMPEL